ncbi:MAG: hypothetical protein MUC98_13995 [Desulfobacterota bacterium]|jgi:hypothetical protein|nr:hypothetical protein [Thermodesulfobacteriota bacterium]
MLTVKITPRNAAFQSILVPVFVASAAEVNPSTGRGSHCLTEFWSRALTFKFNSDLNPTFDLDLVFHFSNQTNVSIVQHIVNDAVTLMNAIGASSRFDLSTLGSATDQEALADACMKLRQFLASFLIPDDALAARFAVLKDSSYQKHPLLQKGSGCFQDPEELQTLETKMGPDFVFPNQKREKLAIARDKLIEEKMKVIRDALLTGNPAHIERIITRPIERFYIVLGKQRTRLPEG